MPPTISPAERKRLAAVRAANKLGVKCTYVAPVPKKKYVPPQLAIVPRPTSNVNTPKIETPDENTIAQWASDDARYHVFQASLNATRPINTKTTQPLPEYLPAQRKYFQGGVVQRTFKRQLSLADDRKYVEYYRHFLAYWKEVQADKPPVKAYEFANAVGGTKKYWYTREDGTSVGPWENKDTRDAQMKRETGTCTPHNGFANTRSTTPVYWFTYTEGTKFRSSDKYNNADARDKALERAKRDEGGNLLSERKNFECSDNAPIQAVGQDGEVVTKLPPIVYGTKPYDKWYNAAHEDLSSYKASSENVPFTESLDVNKLHPVMFCEPVVTDLSVTVNAWNDQASKLRGE